MSSVSVELVLAEEEAFLDRSRRDCRVGSVVGRMGLAKGIRVVVGVVSGLGGASGELGGCGDNEETGAPSAADGGCSTQGADCAF